MKQIDTNKSLRRTQIFGFASLAVMLGVFGTWSVLAELNGAVIASATIVAESYSKKVQHLEGGNIARILVRDGELVQAGQELVELDPTQAKAELAITDGNLSELLVKKARLEALRDNAREMVLPGPIKARANETVIADIIAGQTRLLRSIEDTVASKQSQLNEQIGQLTDQIKGIQSQIDSSLRQRELLNQETDNLRKLLKQGLVPATRIMAMDRDAARLEGEQGQLQASKGSTEAKIGEIKLQIIQVGEEMRNQALSELRDVDAKISELNGRIVVLSSRLAHMTIKAPITGTIYQLNIHTEGGVVAPGETLMMIVPQGDDLVLQAQVSPNDISHVRVGQPARIRFNAFNARTVPEIAAEVSQVAADTTRADQNSPPFYAIRLTISAKELEKLGDNKLKPGMSAEAFVQTESRSPFSYLVKPLMDQIAHAMRES
ncbi:MAG: HlyD family type I secretion periplasmic adaptor subunit [Alphaproteobacteria bacterium]|nr:HlyD family type I secretion periplasmic adaptor subunit [Alphaproteobacteria bacterium]